MRVCYVRSGHRPRGTGSAGLMTFQPLDLSYSVTVLGQLCIPLTHRKADPQEQVPFWGQSAASLSSCCIPVQGSWPRWFTVEAPTLSGLSSVSSEVISFEHSSGLGFLSVASLCLVIVHMSWAPWRGKHVFTVWPQVRHLSPRCLKPAVLRGAPGAPSSSFLDPRSYCSFTDTGRQRKGHRLWSPMALD